MNNVKTGTNKKLGIMEIEDVAEIPEEDLLTLNPTGHSRTTEEQRQRAAAKKFAKEFRRAGDDRVMPYTKDGMNFASRISIDEEIEEN